MAPPTTTTTHKPRIRYHGGTQYTVESRTRPGRLHHVDTYRLTCDCEAGRFGKRCWALVAALHYEDWRRRQHAQAPTSAVRPRGMAALQGAFERSLCRGSDPLPRPLLRRRGQCRSQRR